MNIKSRFCALQGLFLALATTLTLLFSSLAQAGQPITLALYPYVPRLDQFVQSIQARWQQLHPDDPLTVIADDAQWDGGYGMNPTPNLDVFVFDATFLNQFRQAGYLSPLAPGEITNLQDFLPYAINGMQQGGAYSAIPLLGCTDVLFYWKNDPAVASANTLDTLGQALNSCTYTSDVPPDRRGLMIKGKAGDNNYRYVELYYSQYGAFPPDTTTLDSKVINNGHKMLTMGSYLNATYKKSSNLYIYSTWFSQSYGRTMVGYTESMSEMTPAMRANVAFKPMPFSNTGNRPLFYADVIGINSQTNRGDSGAHPGSPASQSPGLHRQRGCQHRRHRAAIPSIPDAHPAQCLQAIG